MFVNVEHYGQNRLNKELVLFVFRFWLWWNVRR